MASLNHEGVLELVRDRPAFAADLLGELLDVRVPQFHDARCVDVTLNQVPPAEYRADAVVMFTRKKPVFGVIIEALLRPRKDKRYTWPLHAVGARARERCPFVVLVVAPNSATARWAARPIELGGGNRYTPLVVGPNGVPKLIDATRARREPQLAVLSVMAHGRDDVAVATAIGTAAAKAVLRLPEEQRLRYSLLIAASLSEAARKAIAMEPELVNFFSEAQRRNFERGEAQGEATGRAKGRAESLLTLLARRGLTLSAAQRSRIIDCRDVAMLKRWLDQSLSVSSVEELFAPPAKRPRGTRRRGRPAAANGRARRR